MKKFLALAALVLGMVSCQTEPEGFDVVVGGEQDVMLSVSLPEGTRADSAQGFNLNELGNYKVRYILEISYNDNLIRDVQISESTSATFPVRLAPNRDYTFTVWADLVTATTVDKETWYTTDLYYNTANGLANIELQNWTPNTEARDAWTATQTVTYTSSNKNIGMELKRPFAKVRVVATDIAEIRKFGIEPTNAVAEYTTSEMYTEFDAVAGVAKGVTTGKKHTFNYDDVDTYEGANGEQLTLFADYVLVPADGNVQFSLSVYDSTKGANALIKDNNFNTTIPVVKNKITTIKGNVLTEGGNVSITVDGVLGNHETFNYIDTAEDLLAAMNENGNFILGSDIELSDAPVAGQASRRNTANEAKKTTIDLNGYTITITNKSDKPLVTVAEGNTLTFAGAGNIVMTSESTAPFVNTEDNDGVVIIEQATITNESQSAAVVEGDAVVNEDAEIVGNAVSGNTFATELDFVLANGGTYVFTKDLTADQIKVTAKDNKTIVLDGNGYTFTYTGSARAIEIPKEATGANVTIKNLNIAFSSSYCERGINYNVTGGTLTIDNVKVSEDGGYATYAINLPGSSDNATVTINNSYLRGNIALNVWGENMTINATNTVFVSYDNTEVENYSAITLNNDGTNIADGTVVNIEGGRIVALDEKGDESNATRNSSNTGEIVISNTTEVIGENRNPVANVVYEGYNEFYSCNTLQAAIDKAIETNGSVRLVKNITVEEPITIPAEKNVVVDLNGKTITAADYAIENYGTLTINGDGTINGVVYGENGTTTVENGTFNAPESGKYVFLNSQGGTLTINGGTINGGSSYPIYSYDENSSLVINDVTVNATFGCVNAYGTNGSVEINGGTFQMTGVEGKTSHIAYFSNVDATINGGTFQKTGDINMSGTGGGGICAIYGANLTIKGGNFAGDYADVYNWGGKNANGREVAISITGGTYTFKPSFIAEGYMATETNGVWVVAEQNWKDFERKLNIAHNVNSTISVSTGATYWPTVAVNPEIYGYSVFDGDTRITDKVIFRFADVKKEDIDENSYKVSLNLAILDDEYNELEIKDGRMNPYIASDPREHLHVYMNLSEVPAGYAISEVKVANTVLTPTTNASGNCATGEYWIGSDAKDLYFQSRTAGLIEVTVSKK